MISNIEYVNESLIICTSPKSKNIGISTISLFIGNVPFNGYQNFLFVQPIIVTNLIPDIINSYEDRNVSVIASNIVNSNQIFCRFNKITHIKIQKLKLFNKKISNLVKN